MTDHKVRIHRILSATTVLVALLGWGAYAYSAKSFATRDQQRLDTIGHMTVDRDQLTVERQRLSAEQQRLQRELDLANVQLVAAREEIASLERQQKSAKKGEIGALEAVAPSRKATQKTPGARARTKVANASQR
jgi:hypothetical protein